MAWIDACEGSGGSSSGSTSKTCSPRTRSRTRLVTRKVAPGRSVRSETTSGAASMICSKLSSTMRSRRPARAIPSCSLSGASPVSRTPSSRAIAPSTSSGSRTCASATNVTRSKRAPALRATSIARRLLPIPPGPTSVTSRCASSPSHSSSVARSRSRPIASEYGAGMRPARSRLDARAPVRRARRRTARRAASRGRPPRARRAPRPSRTACTTPCRRCAPAP